VEFNPKSAKIKSEVFLFFKENPLVFGNILVVLDLSLYSIGHNLEQVAQILQVEVLWLGGPGAAAAAHVVGDDRHRHCLSCQDPILVSSESNG
jgi:hypothetical protein